MIDLKYSPLAGGAALSLNGRRVALDCPVIGIEVQKGRDDPGPFTHLNRNVKVCYMVTSILGLAHPPWLKQFSDDYIVGIGLAYM